MPEKEYLIMFDVDTRKRHRHTTEAGKVAAFMVQLEVKVGDGWKSVVRYDCAHDFAHRDCYNINGMQRKVSLYVDYETALTLADDDIDESWRHYRERFLKGEFPC